MTVPGDDPILTLEAFVEEKVDTARPGDSRSRIPPDLSTTEARWLLEALRPHGDEPPLLGVTAEGKQRSDRFPRLRSGGERGYAFVSENPTHDHETAVQWSAIARLRYHFNWPRAHVICESPRIEHEGRVVLNQDAVDILLLEKPCPVCAWRMPVDAIGTRVVAEVKRNATLVDKLVQEMRQCQSPGDPQRRHQEHYKCLAIATLRPRFFLAVAAGETWRLFSVEEHHGPAALGEELTPDLSALHFRP